MAARLALAPTVPGHYTVDIFACSECGAIVLNAMNPNDYWQCDHGPYGARRRRATDRELLEEILARLERLEARGPDRAGEGEVP
jgi:hypothetical protein